MRRAPLALLIVASACAAPRSRLAVSPDERVARIENETRAWLAARYGAPRGEPAAIRLVAGSDEDSDATTAQDDPPAVTVAPVFGTWARPGAIARGIFWVEWTRGLPAWLRTGLAETVAAAYVA